VNDLPPERPIIVAIAGPNGAGKSTFYKAFFEEAGLPFVNADLIARELNVVDSYEAALQANLIREEYVSERESFIVETVLSDPVGAKIEFLRQAVSSGYTVVFCFIGLDAPQTSNQRVAMRTSQGGHDVPEDKIAARYPRSLENLKRAVLGLPHVYVYDNSSLATPYALVAEYRNGVPVRQGELPDWFKQLQLPRIGVR
jgi:predicted ABC-type ATPase